MLGIILSGAFMTVMDVFVVNVAIPAIRRSLHADFAEVEFVIAGYGLAYAVALITGGRMGDIFGRRRMFIIGLSGFTLTSALCGLAPSISILISMRIVQGFAAALLFPQVLSLIRLSYEQPYQRAHAFAALGIALGLAAICGQVIGGLLVSANLWGLSWRPVFLINIPFGLVGAIAAPLVMKEFQTEAKPRLDLAGAVLSFVGTGLLLYPLVEGREHGWPAWSLDMILASVPVLTVFYFHQRYKTRTNQSPILDTSLFQDRAFSLGLAAVLLFYSTVNATYLAFTLLIQIGLGRSPVVAGLILASNAVTFMIASIMAGRLPESLKPRRMVIGTVLAAAACLLAAGTVWMMTNFQAAALVPALMLWGIGQGFLMTPLLNVILSLVEARHVGTATGALSTMQQVGGALGIAVVGIIFFSVLAHLQSLGYPKPQAYGRSFAAAMLYSAAVSGVVARLLRTVVPERKM